jgi:hypothetical protein
MGSHTNGTSNFHHDHNVHSHVTHNTLIDGLAASCRGERAGGHHLRRLREVRFGADLSSHITFASPCRHRALQCARVRSGPAVAFRSSQPWGCALSTSRPSGAW